MPYAAPVREMRFAMDHMADYAAVAALPGYGDATPDLVEAVLTEADRLANGELAPLNRIGDVQGSRLENGVVRSPDGFPAAWRQFADGGWNGLPFAPEHGGQGLPWVLSTAVQEMWQGANMSFGLAPLLVQGVIVALTAHGTAAQQRRYLPALIEGRWTGTMNLTEPQAGTDLGALRTRAEPAPELGEGVYRLRGQKIYITWGDHDLAENVVHLVLARAPDAPGGSRGISLFVVPKVLVNADGSLGPRNDVRVVSLERKLGIHGSPTCVMAYGDDDGAIGELVGELHGGLRCMFSMMNDARISVGVQGLGIAEHAYQQALAYARQRVQGRAVGRDEVASAIVHHPDVRRMLLWMKSHLMAMRGLAYLAAAAHDLALRHPDAAARAAAQARLDLLTPIVKAWLTDTGVAVASTGVQVHGGMGFIEETGAAQHLRDARILPIYEGTNGVQAQDLVARKIALDGGAAMETLIEEMAQTGQALAASPRLSDLAPPLAGALDHARRATRYMAEATADKALVDALAGSLPYLEQMGITIGGWLLCKGALAADAARGEGAFNRAQVALARYFAAHVLPQAGALAAAATAGADPVMGLDVDAL
ncbi:MAG: acyl-CoA dehydrogenase [Alphaproteobacteria bacterium]